MTNKPLRPLAPTSRNLLARILGEPDLPAQVQLLAPVVLGKLIDQIGLEDAGELVALATTEQLAQVWDEDLWKNERPGEEEKLDAQRFLIWLEILLEAGETFVAERLAALPEDFLTLAFHQHLLVLEVEALQDLLEAEDEDDARLLDKALESCLYEELGEYQIVARRSDGWDALLTAILALDKEHHDLLFRVLGRCSHMTSEQVEESGGLYDVLTSDEMLESDVAGDREDRRGASGYVAPVAAATFLKLARTEPDTPYTAHDPVTKAYFRGLSKVPTIMARPQSVKGSPASPKQHGLTRILQEAGVAPAPQTERLLSASPKGTGAAGEPLLLQAMKRLAADDPALFAERSEELAYLTNVLVSGASFQKRRLRPIEAMRAVIAACSLGLSLADGSDSKVGRAGPEQALSHLRKLPADGLFRRAWREVQKEPGGEEKFLARVLEEA